MAFASTTEWDVRTTGADDNGGGWNTAASGTDYSQQNSPQVTYTDLVIDGADNTKITSAATPFAAAHVGNIINITSGTGFTVQRVQVNSVAANVATCDKAVGTVGSTGGNGKLGGALLTIGTAINTGCAVGGNTVHVKAGTYTLTSVITWSNTAANSNDATTKVIGYNATHGDYGTRPLITTSTNSTELLNTSPGVNSVNLLLSNLHFTNTAGTRAKGIRAVANSVYLYVVNCIMDGFTLAIDSTAGFFSLSLERSAFLNSSSHAVQSSGGVRVTAVGCYFKGTANTANALYTTGDTIVVGCLFANNGYGAVLPGGGNILGIIVGNTFTDTYRDAIHFTGTPSQVNYLIANNIIWNSGTLDSGSTDVYGINAASAFVCVRYNNAYGSNFGGDTGVTITPAEIGALALTVDPFTNSGSNDYSLNSTAGGGAVCKQAAFPGVVPGASTTGYLDVGSIQTQAGATITRVLTNPGMGGGIQG